MIYDLIILGAGAGGLTASIYSSRYKLNHLVFGEKPGGQCMDAHIIENYPGFKSITGMELTEKFVDHAQSYGMKIITEGVGKLRKLGGVGDLSEPSLFEVSTRSGGVYQARSLILAMGARHRALNVPGETDYLGRGVSYCATCDAPLYKGKTVAIVGGGDSAVTAALLLAEYATKVYLIHRRNDFRAEPVWIEKMRTNPRIEEVLENEIIKILGKGELGKLGGLGNLGSVGEGTGREQVGAIELKTEHQGNKTLTVDGVFVEVGLIPAASLAAALGVTVTPDGYVEITADGRTNQAGVFAAGDLCRVPGTIPLRQIITSAAAGALAAASAYSYLTKKAPAPSWG